jgi:hypothetical protein
MLESTSGSSQLPLLYLSKIICQSCRLTWNECVTVASEAVADHVVNIEIGMEGVPRRLVGSHGHSGRTRAESRTGLVFDKKWNNLLLFVESEKL